MDLFTLPAQQTRVRSMPHKSTANVESRSLPFSEDGEKGVLCSLLLSPKDVADLCVLHLRPEAFYVPAHAIIYSLVI
jgi:hypothetical protein